jgi:hypothetical protein
MKLICAELGIHKPIHTKPYRPMGHGKIESFNRFCITNFIAEVKASSITTLYQLNEAFFAWGDEEYNHRKHSELAMSPKQRWFRDVSRIEYIDEEKMRITFLWREMRTPDKTGVIQLFKQRYKVSPTLAKKKVEVRYDPEKLDDIEIYLENTFKQRAKPLQVSPHRAPRELLPVQQDQSTEKKTDYLGWLTEKHKTKTQITTSDKSSPNRQTLTGFLSILREHVAPEVFDQTIAAEFFESFGPFDPDRLKEALEDLLAVEPPNMHLSFYLDYIQIKLMGGKHEQTKNPS